MSSTHHSECMGIIVGRVHRLDELETIQKVLQPGAIVLFKLGELMRSWFCDQLRLCLEVNQRDLHSCSLSDRSDRGGRKFANKIIVASELDKTEPSDLSVRRKSIRKEGLVRTNPKPCQFWTQGNFHWIELG